MRIQAWHNTEGDASFPVKVAITILVSLAYAFGLRIGYEPGGNLAGHILYMLSHANVFHLMANLFCLWLLRGKLHALQSCAISIACSYLPCLCLGPTMGMSGFLMAEIGMRWGSASKLAGMCKAVLPALLLSGLLPNVNVMIHLYCLFVGYLVAVIQKRFGERRRDKKTN